MSLETLTALIAAVSAIVAIIAAWSARRDADDLNAAARRRQAGRAALAAAMTAGHELIEDIARHRRDGGTRLDVAAETSFRERYVAWEQIANGAVETADAAQLARYHRPLDPTHDAKVIIEERLRRLQEIQDRL